MERHHRELIGQLFVRATELLEDAHEIAIAGQHPALKHAKALALARRLRRVCNDVAILAGAIEASATGCGRPASERRKPSRKARGRKRAFTKSGT